MGGGGGIAYDKLEAIKETSHCLLLFLKLYAIKPISTKI